MDIKIEQIAIACKNPDALIKQHIDFGLKVWHHDIVKAEGFLFGKKIKNVAELYFNYDLGYEFEILNYLEGENWHQIRNPEDKESFLSHKGMHVTEIEMKMWQAKMKAFEIATIQEVWTLSHENPVIKGKRKYHYVIFDTIEKFGYDLKLIERIDI